MWALRILSGPQAGQRFELKMGRNVIGRSANCDVKITTAGVSKEHAEIHVYQDKVIVVDLRSSNGTFVNGVKVQNAGIRLGDKVSVHDVIFDILFPAVQNQRPMNHAGKFATQTSGNNAIQFQVNPSALASHNQFQQPGSNLHLLHANQTAPQMHPGQVIQPGQSVHEPSANPPVVQVGFLQRISDFADNNILPGLVKTTEILDFKTVLMMFLGAFVFAVTLLSLIPMVAITKSSIMQEAKRRASSLARTVALSNQQALATGNSSMLTVGTVETEEGVKQVLIVQHSDGMILAPASRAGVATELSFIHRARKESRSQVSEIDMNTIGASYPIGQFNPNTGEPEVKAHAIVIYDVSSLRFDDGRTISLFMQTLIIATLVAAVIFYFMWKLIELPIRNLNQQLDLAMREKRDDIQMPTQFPALQALTGNISSLLTRYITSGGGQNAGGGIGVAINKTAEAESLVGISGLPALAISGQGRIIAVNNGFEQLARSNSLANQTLQAIPDQSLRENLLGLIDRSRNDVANAQQDHLDFSGHNCVLSCQAIASSPTEVDYFLVVVAPAEGVG